MDLGAPWEANMALVKIAVQQSGLSGLASTCISQFQPVKNTYVHKGTMDIILPLEATKLILLFKVKVICVL